MPQTGARACASLREAPLLPCLVMLHKTRVVEMKAKKEQKELVVNKEVKTSDLFEI